MIAIIDYGAGNLQSVKKALDFIGAESLVTSKASEIENASACILPGVGSFGDAMNCMTESGLCDAVKKAALGSKPFLGICLGLQLLFDSSEESPGVSGLGILKGKVKRFPSDMGLKIPHIGWNFADIKKPCPIYDGIADGSFVYFVHSYYLDAENRSDVATKTEYGISFDSSVAVPEINLYATQFHPEKSGRVGLKILENFAKLGGDTLVR